MNLTIKKAQAFFFDRRIVSDAVDRGLRRPLSRMGAFIRVTARQSMKKARQKKIAELTPKELQRFRIRQSINRREGLPPPRRPIQHSKPGEPPRTIVGHVKKFLYFSFEQTTKSVVIGPAKLPGVRSPYSVPEVLEKGNAKQAARPFMWPAYLANEGKIPAQLVGLVRARS